MNNHQSKIIAVDGPAASGKSSICQRVASNLGWAYASTGLLYRAVAYLCIQSEVNPDDEQAICKLADNLESRLCWDLCASSMAVDGKDVTTQLESNDIGKLASRVARHPKLREILLPVQRHVASRCETGLILDGRDIGTVVFPDASMKIYMTASIEERAKRRLAQLGQSSPEALAEIVESIRARDYQDSRRGIAPLSQADDAVVFDTSLLDFEQCITKLVAMIQSEFNI